MQTAWKRGVRAAALGLAAIWAAPSDPQAQAFAIGSRWTDVATGDASSYGDPITLTWSLVPDGTPLLDRHASSLIAFMDAEFGGGLGGDLAARPWFPLIESTFSRWSELGGVRFVYEANDDATPLFASAGILGSRGDVRLAGSLGDGPGRTLASSHYPNAGDIVLDVEEGLRFGNPQQNYLRLRNALMHEIGHVLGLDHVASSDANFLMETALDLSFDGPQLDEIRGLHHLYGDRLERASGGMRNDSLASAVSLGALAIGEQFTLGADARDDPIVQPDEVDFLSISHLADVDYFRFEVAESAALHVELLPRGGRFRQREIGSSEVLIDAQASNDLSLRLLNASGLPLIDVNSNSRSAGEVIDRFWLPSAGVYFLRISGSRAAVQLYEIRGNLGANHVPEPAVIYLALISALFIFHRNARRGDCG